MITPSYGINNPNYSLPSFQPVQQPYIPMMFNRQQVVRVNGRKGAEAYQLPPNSSIMLLDNTAPVVWLKTTDGASYPSLKGYNVYPIQEENAAAEVQLDYSSLEQRISKLQEMVKKNESNDTRTQQKSKPIQF